MKTTLTRFYIVSEVFRDDNRLMAAALKQYCVVKQTKCSIYKDLLNCRYSKWIDRIEEIQHYITEIWLDDRIKAMNNGEDKTFSRGDIDMIEYLCVKTEEEELEEKTLWDELL